MLKSPSTRSTSPWFMYALGVEGLALVLLALSTQGIHILERSVVEFIGTLCVGVLIACWTAERFWSTNFARVVQLFLAGGAAFCVAVMVLSREVLVPLGKSPANAVAIFVIAFLIVMLQFAALAVNAYMNFSMARTNGRVSSGSRRSSAYYTIAVAGSILSISPMLMSERTFPAMLHWWFVWAPVLLVICLVASKNVEKP